MKTKIMILIAITVFIASCSTAYKIKRENKKYKKITSGIRYNSYKKLSSKSIPLIVEQYNKGKENTIEEDDIRVYVGFLMLLAQQNRLAAAEAEMILANDEKGINQYSALNLLASVKQQKSWDHIAKIDYEKASEYEIESVELDTMDFGDFASELVQANLNSVCTKTVRFYKMTDFG